MPEHFLDPEWPAPSGIRAAVTTRQAGDCNPRAANPDKPLLLTWLDLPADPHWLVQQHGTRVVKLPADGEAVSADGSYSDRQGVVCAVLTADCLPVLLCSLDGLEIAAVHAGWRGLAAGVIGSALQHFRAPASAVLAWLGPAIGPDHFEVGGDVRDAFLRREAAAEQHFRQLDAAHWLCNLYGLAVDQLNKLGVRAVHGGTHCTWSDTWSDEQRFFSYRRDKTEQRIASLIWRTGQGPD